MNANIIKMQIFHKMKHYIEGHLRQLFIYEEVA